MSILHHLSFITVLSLLRRDEALFAHVREALLILPVTAWFYYLAAAVCAHRFFSREQPEPGGFKPPVSILKPVRGVDREAYENFASFCRLDYPEYEILFGVSDVSDPVVPIIQKLIRDFPQRSIRLFTGLQRLGPNDKASILAHLAREASYELLVASDSDVRMPPEALRVVAAPFRDPKVGAVTCLYRGVEEDTWADFLEALTLSTDFLASVLVARQISGTRFALGATLATTRRHLDEIGGYEALSEFLLDDYELGYRIAEQGYRVEMLSYVVPIVLPSQSLAGYWQRQLRWMVGVRNSRPWSHLGLLFTQGLPLSLVGTAAAHSVQVAWLYLAAYLASRYFMAWTVGAWGLKDSVLRKRWWLVPARDAVAFCTWLTSLCHNRVSWRGDAFQVRQGRLLPHEAASSR
jgi:ceramide glucosyltransferase